MKVHFEHKRKEILSFEKSSGNIVDVMGKLPHIHYFTACFGFFSDIRK